MNLECFLFSFFLKNSIITPKFKCPNIMTTCPYIRTIIVCMQDLKKELQLAIAKVVKGNRTKSITKSADEIGMGKSMWADLENGIKDPQISTLWRIAEGLDIKLSILVKMIEEDLGEEFSFLEDKTGKARG